MAEQPIIIKRIKKGGHEHHGGAWKLAYADFVTAMMAFFLLLWLLNAVTEEQLQGIADYFAPTTVSESKSGAGGMLGGLTVGKGAQQSNGAPPSFALSLPPPTIGTGGDVATNPKEGFSEENKEGLSDKEKEGLGAKPGQGQYERLGTGGTGAAGAKTGGLSEREKEKVAAQHEQQQFEKAQQELKTAINSIPELARMADSLMVDDTPEGLRIQIVDQSGLAMFPSGSPNMYGHTRALLELVAKVIEKLPERIAISGHTDSVPFARGANYTNWELSADRALATRRVLIGAGVAASRIDRVEGRADTEPLLKNDPDNPRNRRITIVLLRNVPEIPAVSVTGKQLKSGEVPPALKSGGAPLKASPPPPAPKP